MKGIAPLFLGIFGTFAFSWVGLVLIPNYQIGHLDPQMDEDGNDPYPAPKSGMADRGRQIYAANGCIYCHSQQVRADYAGSDIERKWGDRRSAPRDYLFERPVVLGKMRMGPDLANIGKRAPVEEENAAGRRRAQPRLALRQRRHRPQPAPASAASPAPASTPADSPATAGREHFSQLLRPQLRPRLRARRLMPQRRPMHNGRSQRRAGCLTRPRGIIATSTARAALSWIPTCRPTISSMRSGASAANGRPMP